MESQRHVELAQIVQAIRVVHTQLIWKPGSAERHLRRRIHRQHLPQTTTLADYENLIRVVIHQQTAQIYIYWHDTLAESVPYVAIVGIVHGETWLVMFSLKGILESAYLVERPHYYLSEPEFEWVCELGDIA